MRTAATVLAAAALAAVPLSPSSESEGGRAKVAERSGASQRDVYSLKRADRRGRADSREPSPGVRRDVERPWLAARDGCRSIV